MQRPREPVRCAARHLDPGSLEESRYLLSKNNDFGGGGVEKKCGSGGGPEIEG